MSEEKTAARKAAKEISLGATAEASPTTGDETTHHQQPLTPRKRGRPRKIVDRAGNEKAMEYESKKMKIGEEMEQKEEVKEEEARHEEIDLSKIKPSGSRARRKSKPRRSC